MLKGDVRGASHPIHRPQTKMIHAQSTMMPSSAVGFRGVVGAHMGQTARMVPVARLARVSSLVSSRVSSRAAPTTAARGAAVRQVAARASNTSNPSFALLFDCDGVLVETEELHRLAYNASFQHFQIHIDGVQCDWPPEYYDVLANTVGGGKPKMRWHFGQTNWPVVLNPALKEEYPDTLVDEVVQDRLIDDLQDKKTEYYKKIVEEVAEAREGILELMDEAIADPNIAVGICSAATKAGFEKVVNSVVGMDRLACMDVLMAGDDVTKKKPDPLIYNLARERIGLPADKCVVIEDSIVGLRAARGAGMKCIITPCGSTMGQDFIGEGASFVCSPTVAASGVTLRKIFPVFSLEG